MSCSGSDSGSCSEGRGGANDGANVARILHAGEDDEKRGAGAGRSGEEIFEVKFARLD